MKIFKVEVEVDYDGRTRTLGYVQCETPDQAALYFYRKGEKSLVGGEYNISELEIVSSSSLNSTIPSHLDIKTKKTTYGSGMVVIIKPNEEIMKEKRAAVDRAINDALNKTGLSREEFVKAITGERK